MRAAAWWWACAALSLIGLGAHAAPAGRATEVVDVSDFVRWVDSGDEGHGMAMPVGQIGEEAEKNSTNASAAKNGTKNGTKAQKKEKKADPTDGDPVSAMLKALTGNTTLSATTEGPPATPPPPPVYTLSCAGNFTVTRMQLDPAASKAVDSAKGATGEEDLLEVDEAAYMWAFGSPNKTSTGDGEGMKSGSNKSTVSNTSNRTKVPKKKKEKKKMLKTPVTPVVKAYNLTEKELKEGSESLANPEIRDITFGSAGCFPKLSQTEMKVHCNVGGTLKFNYKPRNLDPPVLSLVEGLKFRFVANKTSDCSHQGAVCITNTTVSEFEPSSENGVSILAAIVKQNKDAVQGMKDELTKKVESQLKHDVNLFARKLVLAFFG